MKQTHYGHHDDKKEYENYIHGKATKGSLHVSDCIYGHNFNGIKYFMNQMNEQIYKRNKREPLGKSIIRNYNFPDTVKEENFKFGINSNKDYTAKELIYAPHIENSEEQKKNYEITHGNCEPGHQKNREYNWYEIDKKSHAFGKPQKREYDGAKNSLITDYADAQYPKTILVEKRLEDFRQATDDLIGKSRYKGSMNPDIDDDHIYGKPSIKLNDMWNGGKCIYGDINNPVLFEEDKDLGRSVTHKSKLSSIKPKEYDPNKIFGLPSIRYDLAKKKNISIKDNKVN
jgi:hypothetical protein